MSDKVEKPKCDHGVHFDEEAWKTASEAEDGITTEEFRKRWPRGFGPCPKGCGFDGIAYASYMHYIAGDW